ncbi:tRNA (adenosine(37)-N6)-dimethylallyltransferase MiaA [Rhodospirillum sp. A1_3_36]|uniref:tRNA (adenosine(37)-N6)-dimethylallyltransferase MiaA n=1 Tax=Rhodospirillum sp. A1_3_36 TaxID=3391666 RepID=UPI0039A5B043
MTYSVSSPLLVIVGPTASGKSALALEVARRWTGTVINADSMQIYRDMPRLTARPTPEDEAQVPHALYGILDGAEVCSVGRWLDLARAAVEEVRTQGRLPILCGGTGLYLRAALEGLAAVPAVPDSARIEARRLLAEEGASALHARLRAVDPEMAARLRPSDGQRLARAYEVVMGTGRSLSDWWDEPVTTPPIPGKAGVILVDPPRDAVREACDARMEAMIAEGVLTEVAGFLERGLAPDLPLSRAVGLPELAAVLLGEMSLDQGLARAQAATRQYAKRQATWVRHQLSADLILSERVSAQLSESSRVLIDNFLEAFLLTRA